MLGQARVAQQQALNAQPGLHRLHRPLAALAALGREAQPQLARVAAGHQILRTQLGA